ncbi:hypothetical protein Bca4012_067139 [Brassica carinata]
MQAQSFPLERHSKSVENSLLLLAMAPSLPQPWERLVDANGYVYYWNPETNAAQYDRPTCPPPRNFAQVQDEWRVNHPKLAELCEYAQELMSQFNSCRIQHIGREFNSEADAQANRAINLADGQTQCESRG